LAIAQRRSVLLKGVKLSGASADQLIALKNVEMGGAQMTPLEINYPSEQRKLLIDHLLRDVRATADEAGVDVEAAFLDVAVRDFGYDIERGFRTDSR
jgi:hypothetical protein